ncbi:restriction endonuclease [Geodermatophilus sp. CPCC 205506]|uniref:restriction endonuclease n=1 Tax=Geodermatophilus sp. CPCC 205506 TaxID=2936596 RepID=UPI003EE829F5
MTEGSDAKAQSTDDEVAVVVPTDPQWRAFELSVTELIRKMDPDADVEHDARITGKISGTERQVDVLVSGSIGGQQMSIAIECKHYANRLGIGKVDEFAGKLLDLGVDRGVLYSINGTSEPAVARAENAIQPRIVLKELVGATPKPPEWSTTLTEFTGFGDCPNDNCYTGDIGWREWPQETGETVDAGSCDTCGTWGVRCLDCGVVTGFFGDSVECDNCGTGFEMVHDRDRASVEEVLVTHRQS